MLLTIALVKNDIKIAGIDAAYMKRLSILVLYAGKKTAALACLVVGAEQLLLFVGLLNWFTG